MLTHHRLKVYEKALDLAAGAQELCAGWGRRHAIVEHFRRASESIVLNIAEWGRLVSGSEDSIRPGHSELDHRRFLEIAAASAVKATPYLDLYRQKCLPANVEIAQGRELLSRIVAMLSKF